MKRGAILVVLALLVAGLVGGTSTGAQAAKKKTFKEVFHCTSHPYGTGVEATVFAGHFGSGYVRSDDYGSCHNWEPVKWHPSVGAFTATFRWYVGSKLVRKQARKVANRGKMQGTSSLGRAAGADHPEKAISTWSAHGKRVKVKITLTKKGYQSRTYTVSKFRNYWED